MLHWKSDKRERRLRVLSLLLLLYSNELHIVFQGSLGLFGSADRGLINEKISSSRQTSLKSRVQEPLLNSLCSEQQPENSQSVLGSALISGRATVWLHKCVS